MLIDLHCHTKVMSPCSALTPDALVRAAMARGFDGVCITEHDALWTAADIARVADEMRFLVLRGMEVTTEVGHVLVFGMEHHDPAMAVLGELYRIVRDAGALMFLAHPSRRYGSLPPDDLSSVFDSVEVQNGTEGMLQNDNAGVTGALPAPLVSPLMRALTLCSRMNASPAAISTVPGMACMRSGSRIARAPSDGCAAWPRR